MRDALNQLEGEGLVVNTETGRQVIDLDEGTVRELYDLRLALESLAVRLATERIGPEETASLNAKLAEMRDALERGDLVAYGCHDLELHALIWRYAGNRFVERDMAHWRMVVWRCVAPAHVLAITRSWCVMAVGDAAGAVQTSSGTWHTRRAACGCSRRIPSSARRRRRARRTP